jgi:hypothetical protein
MAGVRHAERLIVMFENGALGVILVSQEALRSVSRLFTGLEKIEEIRRAPR